MQALWPRGFVDESNLTKHIWLIRKALGDSENDSRCIETVPKLGYRFIAPVQVGARGDDSRRAEPTIPPGASTPVDAGIAAPVRAHIRHVSAALLLGALAIGAIVWTGSARKPDMSASAQQGTAVAIVDFNNLSQNAKDAWLGPALVEMLGLEVAIGDHVYVVPDELVRTARSGLAVPLAGGYALAEPRDVAQAPRRRLRAERKLSRQRRCRHADIAHRSCLAGCAKRPRRCARVAIGRGRRARSAGHERRRRVARAARIPSDQRRRRPVGRECAAADGRCCAADWFCARCVASQRSRTGAR